MDTQRTEDNEQTAPIAWDRDEGAPCQRGTDGCPVDHMTGKREWPCETW